MIEQQGALDNYLSADEEAYFKGRGSDEAEDKVEESLEDESDSSADAGDISTESESENRADINDKEYDADSDSDDDGRESDDDDRQLNDEPKSKADRDYEKAFKAERHKRKELKEALEANAKKTAQMEQALLELKNSVTRQGQQQQSPQVAPEPTPDPDEDPLGYLQHQIKQQERVIVEHNKYLKERHQYEQQNSQKQAFMDMYQKAAMDFSQKSADFKDAYKHLVQSKTNEFVAAGYSPQQAEQLLIEDEMAIVAKSFQDGVNPAERIYNLAKNRGYDAKANIKAPAKNISDLKKGIANSKSLKSGGSEVDDKNYGVDDVDGMTFDEFDKFWAGYKNKAKGSR